MSVRGHRFEPEKEARALQLARQGLHAAEIAQRVDCSPKTVRGWAAAAGVPIASRRNTLIDGAVVAACEERNAAGEALAALAREHSMPESTLAAAIKRLREARAQARRRDQARSRGAVREERERVHRARPEPVVQERVRVRDIDDEPRPAAPTAWISELKPRGRRLVLELADDGLGDTVLLARLEALHAAPTCRRCATEASTRPALALESWNPSATTGAQRVLLLLSGLVTSRTGDVAPHTGGVDQRYRETSR